MIRRTLPRTKSATFSILFPGELHGMPLATGTAFMIDPTGYMLTACHVVENQQFEGACLMQSTELVGPSAMLQWPEPVESWPQYDLALLKVDFAKNANKYHLEGLTEFPYVSVDASPVEEGTPVYAFGYPLPINKPPDTSGPVMVGHVGLGHRTTSAIVSSVREHTKMLSTSADAQIYVLDKALNYGNSGGPIVNQETGSAFAVCSRFQPVVIPQGTNGAIMIPSLYGIVTSISNIANQLRSYLTYE
jgi:serine protease Do